MANELTLLHELEPAIPFTVDNATAITKGALLELLDPMTASGAATSNSIVAGVAKGDKIASDGNTEHALYLRGIFKATASGAITVGNALQAADTTSPNMVRAAVANASGANVLGVALETAATGETFKMLLNVGSGGTS